MAGGSSGQGGWAAAGLGPGSLIAGYRVEGRIGAGGMAMVLRARDEALGRTVALKILAPALASDVQFRDRFVRESRAVAAVDHPHIIPVYAAGEADGILYLAMRYITGGDLRTVVQREGPLPGHRAVALLSPVASALDAAHRVGLVHRDVKPANILVDIGPDRPEHPYLSDFGLAKGASSSTGLTGTGQYLGTPDYSAPEQISGKRTGPRTDQYALACVAYTMLTGSLPFPRDESMAVLWAHMYDQPPQVTSQRSDLPAAINQVIARALAKTPSERYTTCGEFINALETTLAAPARTVRTEDFAGLRPSATETAARQRPGDGDTQAPPWSTQTVTPSAYAGPGREYADGNRHEANAPPYQARALGNTVGGAGRADRGGRFALGPLRGKRLLLASAALVVIGLAAYLLVPSPKPTANSPNAGGALPTSGSRPTTTPLAASGSTSSSGLAPTSSSLATPQDCATFGTYCHIEIRGEDPAPLTTAELFPAAFSGQADHVAYSLVATEAGTTCANALIGQSLIDEAQAGDCTQVLRASYISGNATIMGTIGVVNLETTSDAEAAGQVVGQSDFIAPLPSATGVASSLGQATGVSEAEYKGHYLILTWSQFANAAVPSTSAQQAQLEQFSADLVAGSVNPDLTVRMLTGLPPSAA